MMKRFNVQMSDELLAAVDQYAKQWSVSRSGAICVMCSQFMEQSQAMRSMPGFMSVSKRDAD